ncbi:MAG: putative addiction module antidote protein [Planctomycetes bacterium]|nr:putative addiction module antidote protein [Planctomycetota bacterium]
MKPRKNAFTRKDLRTTRFDVMDHLVTPDDMAGYLKACLDEGGVDLFLLGLGDVIKAQGIAKIAKETGLSREGLYNTFKPGRKPQFDTVHKITEALGLTISIGTV